MIYNFHVINSIILIFSYFNCYIFPASILPRNPMHARLEILPQEWRLGFDSTKSGGKKPPLFKITTIWHIYSILYIYIYIYNHNLQFKYIYETEYMMPLQVQRDRHCRVNKILENWKMYTVHSTVLLHCDFGFCFFFFWGGKKKRKLHTNGVSFSQRIC